jgi:hypothetical protein
MIVIFRVGRSLSNQAVYGLHLTEIPGAKRHGPIILTRRLLAS